MSFNPTRYQWDANGTNTAPLDPALLANGYPTAAIPTSAQFNELWRNVSALALQAPSSGEVRTSFDPSPPWLSAGWFQYVDGTIGSATSGATVRANADTQNLYVLLWNTCADAQCPVIGGRGANAAADFSANKQLTLPEINGQVLINVAGGTYVIAQSLGETTHALTSDENGTHTHTLQWPAGATEIPYSNTNNGNGGGASFRMASAGRNFSLPTLATSGLSAPHNNIQPSTAIYFYMKL